MIALTFDDGPNEPYTRQILDVLAEYGAKATFFVIGKWVRQSPEIVREVADAGHEVGNHTETHPSVASLDFNGLAKELQPCAYAIAEALNWKSHSRLFRHPFGQESQLSRSSAWCLGCDVVRWDIHGSDWVADSVESITEPIFKYLDEHGKGIVLLHDGYYKEFGADRSKTVEATRRILERYKGEKFVTIEEYQQCLTHCA